MEEYPPNFLSGDILLTYGSICTGIGSETLAWHILKWKPKWFAEIDPYCSKLLLDHYKDIPNLGDITKREINEFTTCDVIVGGTPCQAFSINGIRKGMDDPRGRVTVRFLSILQNAQPKWVVWENVENILSIEEGRIFRYILDKLEECGYGWSYRVFDLRSFGYPQSRRRLFLVGTNRGCQYAFASLFNSTQYVTNKNETGKIQNGSMARVDGWAGDMTPKRMSNCIPTLKSSQGGEGTGIIVNGKLRKLTIREHERVQGFHDDYTILTRSAKQFSNSVRRSMIGNSFPPPILYWIGNRINFLENYYVQKSSI